MCKLKEVINLLQEKLNHYQEFKGKRGYLDVDKEIEALTYTLSILERLEKEMIANILSEVLNQNLYEVDGATLKVNVLPTEEIIKQQATAILTDILGE